MQKSFGELKDMAKGSLSGKYGPAVRTILFYYILTLLAERFFVGSAFLTILSMLFSNFLFIGVSCYFLALCCKEFASAADFFIVFTENTGKALLLGFLYTMISFFATLPASVFLTLYYRQSEALPTLVPMLCLLQVVFLAAWVPIHLYFSQSIFLFLDFPQYDVKTILLMSAQKMKGQKLRFFLFELSFLPLFILVIPTFGIGLIWLVPYFLVSKVHFYLQLMHPSECSPTSGNH